MTFVLPPAPPAAQSSPPPILTAKLLTSDHWVQPEFGPRPRTKTLEYGFRSTGSLLRVGCASVRSLLQVGWPAAAAAGVALPRSR
jgi:hypothetical protein